jgi:hypothetical protein
MESIRLVWNLYGYHLIREYDIYMIITLLESMESMENCLSPTRESPSGLKMKDNLMQMVKGFN